MNIISFSLWGTTPKYCIGAVNNAQLARIYYPGWQSRYYVDSSVPLETLNSLRQLDCELVHMPVSIGARGLLWRFLAASDPIVDRFISRDCDSRISPREASAVQEWIASGYHFHVIKDHPWHNNDQILGGLWGCKAESVRQIDLWYDNWPKHLSGYGHDQRFLDQHIYPIAQGPCLVHNDADKDALPLPYSLEGYRFVGLQFDEHDIPSYETMIALAESRRGKSLPNSALNKYL